MPSNSSSGVPGSSWSRCHQFRLLSGSLYPKTIRHRRPGSLTAPQSDYRSPLTKELGQHRQHFCRRLSLEGTSTQNAFRVRHGVGDLATWHLREGDMAHLHHLPRRAMGTWGMGTRNSTCAVPSHPLLCEVITILHACWSLRALLHARSELVKTTALRAMHFPATGTEPLLPP